MSGTRCVQPVSSTGKNVLDVSFDVAMTVSMGDWLLTLFGDGPDLTPLQMSARALAVFVVALLLLRLAGRRALGQRSPFDVCIIVLLGAVLSRAVVGASPFLATISAAAVLVVLHRLVAWWGVRSPMFERLVTGHERVLIDRGVKN